jgi:elongation factor P--(R)-beta-lysine ligase
VVTHSPWWSHERHADRRPFLLARNRMKAAFRAHFEAQNFVEVECAQLQVSPGNETHLHAFASEAIQRDGSSARYYLHTSPEFACKKLLAAGERRIFDFARVFRNREHAPLNVSEFTMLEWYRAEETYDAVIADCIALIRLAAEVAGSSTLSYRGHSVAASAEPERISLAEAFRRYADVDLLATLTPERGDRAALATQALRVGVAIADDDTWPDIFSRVLSERVEPRLGFEQPVILDEYPRVEAALARASARGPRFEVYVCGVELANGFGELTDPAEQRRRFKHEMEEKERIYGERYPIDEDFLSALNAMPAASGVALGFDRLVMLATGAPSIEHVLWTPPVGRT